MSNEAVNVRFMAEKVVLGLEVFPGLQLDPASYRFNTALISLPISRRMELAGHVARMGDRRGACRVLVSKPVGK